ncbi:hypothetical protein ATOBIA_N00430 [Atopobiaceae bacterium P1]|uniref:Uncharacterized protein n=1 Tax=Leptogranulimonas caecicola TaxID=2894156 RepID=A0AAU9CDQ9_9ACTN|nr:hypothetical protein ATOBIA_N00430 [Atopobiaceae bacterium P1]BDC90171.1 hypothetical protein ATTO_00430 [Leptogranulimonas caecicola]
MSETTKYTPDAMAPPSRVTSMVHILNQRLSKLECQKTIQHPSIVDNPVGWDGTEGENA